MSGKELQELREAAELTRPELAARMGVSLASVVNWEGRAEIRRPVEIAARAVLEPAPKRRQRTGRIKPSSSDR